MLPDPMQGLCQFSPGDGIRGLHRNGAVLAAARGRICALHWCDKCPAVVRAHAMLAAPAEQR